MDATTIAVAASFITSVGAIILGIAGILAQNRRDNRLAEIDQGKANRQAELDKIRLDLEKDKTANDSIMAIIQPLREEITRLTDSYTRLQARTVELENALIEKTKAIGLLMQEGIDKDFKYAQLQYNMENIKMRLDTLMKKEEITKPIIARTKRTKLPVIDPDEPEKLELYRAKKAEIRTETNKEIEELKSKSISNDITHEGDITE